jgi:hypothetical protein
VLFTVYLLGVKLCPRTIRGGAADTFHAGERSVRPGGEPRGVTQTKFTVAALFIGFTIAALIVVSAIGMGAVAGT